MQTMQRSWVALTFIACAACGGSTASGGTATDSGLRPDGTMSHPDAPAPGAIVGDCSSAACPPGSTCYFPIGSCSATPRCIEDPSPGTPECRALEELCGCDGEMVTTGCGYPGGYASGPTTGASFCATDASTGVDASARDSAADLDASPPPDGGMTREGGSPDAAAKKDGGGPRPDSGQKRDSGARPDSGEKRDSGARRDGGEHRDSGGGPATSCPDALPTVGDACDLAYSCEYGSDPDVRCDTVAACSGGDAGPGHWVISTEPSTTGCGTQNAAGCPASFSGIGADYPGVFGASCSMPGLTCDYPEARCDCSQGCGMEGIGDGAAWCCNDGPAGGACPSVRPRLGTACTGSADCDYGECTGNIGESCTGGVWLKMTYFGCPG